MIKIKQVIVVEGKYDKIKLSRIFDTLIITTDGFYVYKSREKAEFIKNMALKNGVIILTDSDKAGFRIRNYLKNILKDADVRNAYIPEVEGKEKRKEKAGKEGLLGVEGISDEIIINAVMSVADKSDENCEKVTKTDFYKYGLCGAKSSAENRQRLAKVLNLPLKISSNGLLDIINNMYSKEEFLNIINGGIKKMSIKKSNFG